MDDFQFYDCVKTYFIDRGLISITVSPPYARTSGDNYRYTVNCTLSDEDAILYELAGKDALKLHIHEYLCSIKLSPLIVRISARNLVIE